jgi:Cu-Zn family superoxide dismutase
MSNSKLIKAIAVFPGGYPNKSKVEGYVEFTESSRTDNINIKIKLSGLTPGKHGFHIHETGNLLDDCSSCKAHFNPFGTSHGGLKSIVRHLGDLGNIIADKNGNVDMKIVDNQISLRGLQRNIIGRSLVIHADEDDLGKGGNEESLKTGNAGKRIGCAVIGYADAYYF